MKFLFRCCLTVFVFAIPFQGCGAQEPVPSATMAPTNPPTSPVTATSTIEPSPRATRPPLFEAMPTLAPNLTATEYIRLWNTSQAEQKASTPGATRTPNLAATQQMEDWNAEAQSYFDSGYLKTSEGQFMRFSDFSQAWPQLGWYYRWPLSISASDFFMSGHFKWSSAYRSADISGCGFYFAEQPNEDHYAAFLDRSKVLFVQTEEYYDPMGPTRGTGLVKFGNPFDQPVEADFTLIVKDAYAYVLVDGEVVGEYTLSQSKILEGYVGLALLSGTNKDFGTRCEITNLHLWLPKD